MQPTAIRTAYEGGMRFLLAAAMLTTFLIMCAQIVFRYLLNDALIWAEEVCKYLLVWMSFLGVGLAYSRGEIAAFRMVEGALGDRLGACLRLVGNLAALGLLVVLVVYGWRYAVRSGRQSLPAVDFILGDLFGDGATAHVTIFWIYIALPIGMGLLALHIAVESALVLWRLVKGVSPALPPAPAGVSE